MSIFEDIRQEVNEMASTRSFQDHKAFGYWFLETIEDFSEEEAETYIVDGPWDQGRDAVILDEDESTFTIYQFKYSQDLNYSLGAFSDVQRAVQAEENNLRNVDKLRIVIVTLATANAEIREKEKNTQRYVRSWITRRRLNCVTDIEVYDLTKFAQLRERLYGVNTTLGFKDQPVESDSGLLGLANASELAWEADKEELFAFNVRQFLGVRKGSVNEAIRDTLAEESMRDRFWTLNNGIVCLCTKYETIGSNEYNFENLTIVNGAQTINTIAKFLDENPAVTEPIWVVAKLLIVDEEDVDRARELTRTSNTQTPTSNKDLRAADINHRRLRDWFSQYSDVQYIFRRGDRAARGNTVIQMKDVAQAYISFWSKLPHVSFAQVGKIFGDDDLYSEPFPTSKIASLRQSGASDEITKFLEDRLLAHGMLQKIRGYLKNNAQDQTHKSLAYHILWIYGKILEEVAVDIPVHSLYEKHVPIVDNTIERISDGIRDFFASGEEAFPRVLKSTKAADKLTENLNRLSWFSRAKSEIQSMLVS